MEHYGVADHCLIDSDRKGCERCRNWTDPSADQQVGAGHRQQQQWQLEEYTAIDPVQRNQRRGQGWYQR